MRTFAGHPIQLFWQDLKVLEIALSQAKPNLIIELGTGSGASTLFFSNHCATFSVDIKDKTVFQPCLKSALIRLAIFDIFEDSGIKRIKDLITAFSKVFVFCDNGDKPREFELFAPMIKPGDYIAVHDVGIEISTDQVDTVHFKNKLEPVIENLAKNEKSLIRVFKKGV